jgi:hypothetical protein
MEGEVSTRETVAGRTQAREWQMPADITPGRQAGKLWKPVLTSERP